ncbi:MAG: T9SS type A sorting domain-containing protein, partial [Ignavibacteria bacterium]
DFSVAKNKSIYMPLFDINGSSPPDLYKTIYSSGQYSMPESLGNHVNSDYNEFGPYIDPDERFIIFISNRPGGYGMHDLYLSSRNLNGTWNDPVNLGPGINSNEEDGAPYISPDGLYFFFTNWRAEDLGYNPYWVDAQVVYDLITDVDNENPVDVPNEFQLYQNYPNPFNPQTRINFSVPEISLVSLKVFDVLGKEIATLVDEEKKAGTYEVGFDAVGLTSGIYFYKLVANNHYETKKMIILK